MKNSTALTALTARQLRCLKSVTKRTDAGNPIRKANDTHHELRRLGLVRVVCRTITRTIKVGSGKEWRDVMIDVVTVTDTGRAELACY